MRQVHTLNPRGVSIQNAQERELLKGGEETCPFIFVSPLPGTESSQCAAFNRWSADCMVIDGLNSQSLCTVQELKRQLAQARNPESQNEYGRSREQKVQGTVL